MKKIDIELIFNNGKTYQNFYNKSDEKSKKIMKNILENKVLSKDTISLIDKIDSNINILVIGENWCPDCIINITALEIMKNLNNNINYKIIEKKGLENEFKEYHYDFKLKMPTIFILYKDFCIKGAFVEVPKLIRELEKSDDQVKRIKLMKEYRKGHLIEDTIMEILDRIYL